MRGNSKISWWALRPELRRRSPEQRIYLTTEPIGPSVTLSIQRGEHVTSLDPASPGARRRLYICLQQRRRPSQFLYADDFRRGISVHCAGHLAYVSISDTCECSCRLADIHAPHRWLLLSIPTGVELARISHRASSKGCLIRSIHMGWTLSNRWSAGRFRPGIIEPNRTTTVRRTRCFAGRAFRVDDAG